MQPRACKGFPVRHHVKWVRIAGTLVLVGTALAGAAHTSAMSGQAVEIIQGREAVAGDVLVRFPPNASALIRQIEQEVGADKSEAVGSQEWHRFHSRSQSTDALLRALASHLGVLAVQPNFVLRATAVPNDPQFSLLWGLQNLAHPGADIHAVNAWNVSTGSRANVVAVIDTGIDYTHPDLQANIWSAPTGGVTVKVAGATFTCPAGSHGFNALTFNPAAPACGDPMDDNHHGTHVAGTIGAVGNNGVGVAGVNWTASLMALKFLDSSGSGSSADAINAIEFAIQAKAALGGAGGSANVRVLSNSYGGGGFDTAMFQEIQSADAADMLFVAAAGNASSNNDSTPFYPASYNLPNVVSVAATDETDGLASFSNYGGTTVHLGAPGNNIYSTLPGSAYGYLSGTSMATPHVSGAAALILSACSLTTEQVVSTILNHVDVIPSLSGRVSSNGRLDVDAAIRSCAPANVPPTVTLTGPSDGATFTTPVSIPLTATAADSDGTVSQVQFFSGGTTLIGTGTLTSGTPASGSYTFTWNAPAGSYTLTAVATDNRGAATTSAPPVHITVTGTGPTAHFVTLDATTQGTWRGVYGADGYTLANDASSLPAYAHVTFTGQSAWTWTAATIDVRALQEPTGTNRIAATWYAASTYSIDLNLTDGATHQVALYGLDWDSTARTERIDILDPVSGATLDSRTLTAFHGGQYLVWNLSGHLTLRVTCTGGANAVVSGLFFR
jgi:subtilisin family serine protease